MHCLFFYTDVYAKNVHLALCMCISSARRVKAWYFTFVKKRTGKYVAGKFIKFHFGFKKKTINDKLNWHPERAGKRTNQSLSISTDDVHPNDNFKA
ncbi:mediator of RNA polymerase II transcription subunit 22 [Trichinella spiralis]|uniref:mediator of RNA polymerase II transcription subunit 22 n=1 Tax=Trichinella spiralis TaxID=6334 RepID=UPI0001EFB47A|nr:mediator of RNA polymerase II transcription subunit 22 [Trichinella spiralis]